MKRRLLASLFPVAVACVVATSPAHADVYAFVDGNGVRHLSNIPSDPRYKLVMRTPAYRKEDAQLASSFSPSGAIVPRDYDTQTTKAGRVRLSRINEGNRERLTPDINRIAAQYGLEPALMHAVISAESGYNQMAVSNKGAMGLMQLMPGTAERFGVGNAYDPISNMHGGARYLRFLLDRFNDPRLAVAGYNAGEGAVEKYGRQIPPYRETQGYVVKVLGYYDRYRNNTPNSRYAYTSTNSSPQQLAMNSARTPILPRVNNGVVVITPRVGNRPASLTNMPSASFAANTQPQPNTYFQPTGRQIVMGSSQAGAGQRVVRVNLPARTLASDSAAFSGNDQ